MGTATDPYQPIEGHYRLTRRIDRGAGPGPDACGDRHERARWSCAIATCSAICTRTARCTVYMSVPTVDEDAWRQLEPGTAHPLQRLRAVRELTDAGINAGVLMAPIVPGFSSLAVESGTDDQGHRRSRRAFRRLQRDVSAGWHARRTS